MGNEGLPPINPDEPPLELVISDERAEEVERAKNKAKSRHPSSLPEHETNDLDEEE